MGRRPASDREHSRQEKDRALKRRRRDLLQDAEASKSNTTFLETTPEKVVAGGKPVIAANGANNVSRRSRATRLPEDAKTVNGVHAAQAVTNVVEKPTTELRSRTTQIAAATVATSPARVAATAPALSSSLAEVAAAAIISGSTAELTPASTPAGSDLAEVTATPPAASTSIPVVSAAQPFDLSNLRTIVINLERRPDRWQGCTDRLRLHCPGLPFERFVASDGRQDVIVEHEVALSWHTGKNVVYQRKRSVRKGWDDLSSYVERSLSLSPGERGCSMSHIRAWRLCLDNAAEAVAAATAAGASEEERRRASEKPLLVLEDDAAPTPEFVELLQQAMAALPHDAHLLYLGYSQAADWKKEVAPALVESEYVWTTVGYIVWPAGARLMLSHLPINQPVDNWMAQLNADGELKSYCVRPKIVRQSDAWNVNSDVGHSDEQYWGPCSDIHHSDAFYWGSDVHKSDEFYWGADIRHSDEFYWGVERDDAVMAVSR